MYVYMLLFIYSKDGNELKNKQWAAQTYTVNFLRNV